jgi:hypothetical protein
MKNPESRQASSGFMELSPSSKFYSNSKKHFIHFNLRVLGQRVSVMTTPNLTILETQSNTLDKSGEDGRGSAHD